MGDSRNERMGERGEGRGTMSPRSAPSLEPKTAALVRIAAAIAAGKTAELEPRLGAARGAGVPVLWIEELAHADWEAWAERGAVVCRDVYGRAYHKLLVNLRTLHPALEDLVLVDAYGKVIGRPG